MIDEYWTWMFYGYHSDELKPKSNKPIVAKCDDCCQYRISSNHMYRGLCIRCAHMSKYLSDSTVRQMSESHIGNQCTEETKLKMSKARTGKKRPPPSEKSRQHWSAGQLGIPYEEWTGFVEHNWRDWSKAIYINPPFDGCHRHHITKTIVVCIPKELHEHIHHNIKNGTNMGEINLLALQFINGEL